jgi:hypothetical protein
MPPQSQFTEFLDPGVPALDLDDQAPIDAALAAADAPLPVAVPIPAPVAPIVVPSAPSPASPAPRPLGRLVSPAAAGVTLPAAEPPRSLGLAAPPPEALPAGLAPDFRRLDYARAVDRLAAPTVDPTAAAEITARAESNLRELETTQAGLQDAVIAGARQRAQLDQEITSLRAAPASPERDAALVAAQARAAELDGSLEADRARYQAVGAEVETARQGRASAREQYQTELDAAAREGEVLAAAAETAAIGAAAAEDERILRESAAREAELREQETEAQQKLDADRRAYRDLLERGPEQTTRSVLVAGAAILGEALAARAQRRPPNFGAALAPIEQATQADFQRRVQARLAGIEDQGDAVARAARERDALRAETATRRAEALSTIERQLDQKIAESRGRAQEAQLLTVRDDVRAARDAKLAEALAAEARLAAERQKAQQEAELRAAQVRKTSAEAALAERKSRGGSGGGVAGPAQGVREPTAIYMPNTDLKLADFKGQKDDVKRAEKANTVVNDAYGFLQTLNEYEALIEDYGPAGLADKSNFSKSEKYREIEAAATLAAVKLAKVIAGPGFSTTESDIKTARSLLQLPSNWWERADGAKIAVQQLKKKSEDELRLRLNPFIETASQERLIKQARARGFSQADRRADLLKNARTILGDEGRDEGTRAAAVEAVVEQVRTAAPDDPDWPLTAIQVLRNAAPGAAGPVRQALDAKIAELRALHLGTFEEGLAPRSPTIGEGLERVQRGGDEFPGSIR